MFNVVRYFIVLILCFSNPTYSQNNAQFIKSLPCASDIGKQVQQFISPPNRPRWFSHSTFNYYRSYFSPTPKVGLWLELRAYPDGRTELLVHSEGELIKVQFQGNGNEGCTWKIENRQRSFHTKRMKASFTDQSLTEVLQKSGSGVIYAWSPSMPFSIQGASPLEQAARRLGLKVYYTLDPHADPEQAARALSRLKQSASALLPNESIELYYRGVGVHYPAIIVFDKGKIKGQSIPGVKSVEGYLDLIQRELKRPPEFTVSENVQYDTGGTR